MIARRRLPLICLGLLSSLTAAAAAAKVADLEALIERRQMIFIVAKGGPSACGAACSEWIVAEGMFDRGAAQRFRDLLGTLPGRNLPVFFNSPGGHVEQAVAIGAILREHRMTVGVGRTLPEGCRQTTDETCRRTMQSKHEHRARLLTDVASCLSACVYAIVGGTTRQLARDVRLGVHTLRMPVPGQASPPSPPGAALTVDDAHHRLKRYILEMGVDPGLIDLAAKVSADRVRYLSRDEIRRFGIEVGGSYETPWIPYEDVSKRFYALKAVTQAEGDDTKEYRTRLLRVGCDIGGWIQFLLRRELLANEIGVPMAISVAAGDGKFALEQSVTRNSIEVRYGPARSEFVRNAMAAPHIVVTETLAPAGNASSWSRATKFSTDGLGKALEQLQKDCGAPNVAEPSGVKYLNLPGAAGGAGKAGER